MKFDKDKELEEIKRLYTEYSKTWEDEEYDKICSFNDKYLNEYCDYLEKVKHLNEKTIDRHYSHVSFFLNEHLTRYLHNTVFSPSGSLEDFFGYFLIYKCYSSKSYITTSCTCISSFYKFMSIKGYVEIKEYEEVVMIIKEGKERWIEELWNYENGCDERTLFYNSLEEGDNSYDN